VNCDVTDKERVRLLERFPVHDVCIGNLRRIHQLVNFAEVSDALIVHWESLQQLEVLFSTPPSRNVDPIEMSDGGEFHGAVRTS